MQLFASLWANVFYSSICRLVTNQMQLEIPANFTPRMAGRDQWRCQSKYWGPNFCEREYNLDAAFFMHHFGRNHQNVQASTIKGVAIAKSIFGYSQGIRFGLSQDAGDCRFSSHLARMRAWGASERLISCPLGTRSLVPQKSIGLRFRRCLGDL